MKVITEEDLIIAKNIHREANSAMGVRLIDYFLTHKLQEVDTLTVSKLRPMSDAITCNDPMAAYHIEEKRMLQIELDCLTGKWDTLIGQCGDSEFMGFELMVTYKPELIGDGE
ncbi:hypothetical protein [Nitrosomonas sp.]|uniref:hypothetical protein n=1 Tax=Nitrosomonas sp. TaxID=42353 RepID=UPI0025F5DEBD|nr:hypothetical protein [Nitrosomonas sp.]MBY0484580.1 hypothetical protein [Nitrosomonas sp.]